MSSCDCGISIAYFFRHQAIRRIPQPQLAKDILSTEPVTRNEIKRIMDAGWDATLGDGMQIELEANKAHAKAQVRADKVAARRADIQHRGRDQSKG